MGIVTGKGRSTFLSALCVLCAAASITLSAHAATGRTPGQAQVSASGAAQYSMALWTPPGTNGLRPTLELRYSSAAQNGLAGVGFTLSGLSSITRCNQTIAQDGAARAVTLNSSDPLCLDGARLMLVSGTQGAANSTYQTQTESFRRVSAQGAAGGGPAWFVVETQDGLIYEYGNSADARIEAYGVASVHEWALNKIRDRAGNYVEFVYAEDTANSAYRPTEIRWTGNGNQGTSPVYRYTIVYEAANRPDVLHGHRFDHSVSAVNGLITQEKRIDRLELHHAPSGQAARLLRRYDLTYESAGGAGARSRLQSVRECAGAAGTDCMAPTTFSWVDGSPGWGAETNTPAAVPAGVTPLAMDLNGDGRDDLVWPSHATSGGGNWHFMLADPASGGFGGVQNSGVTNTRHDSAFVIEWDGDGRDDLIVPYNGSTWWVLRSNGVGFQAPVDTGISVQGDFWFADVDGDGRDDMVRAAGQACTNGPEYTNIYLRLNAGAAFGAETFGAQIADVCPHAIYPFGRAADKVRSGTRRPDFNGDGREDLVLKVATFESGRPVSSQTGTQLILSGGTTGLMVGPQVSGTTFNPRWGDVNGDGLSDFGYDLGSTFRVLYSTGLGFGATQTVPLGTDYAFAAGMLTDWDHDGLDDYVVRRASPSTWWVARAQRNGSFAVMTDTGLAAGDPAPTVIDVNGDGLDDLLHADASTGTVKYRGHRVLTTEQPDLLDRVTDGLGVVTEFDYAPLSDASVYSPLDGAIYPTRAYRGLRYVVKQYRFSDGIGGLARVDYTYAGAREDLWGRGFLGFVQRRVTDARSGRVTLEQYHQYSLDYELLGRPSLVQVRQSAAGPLIREITYTWARHYLGDRRLPYLSQLTMKDYEVGGIYNGAHLRTTTTVNSVDPTTGAIYDSTTTTTEEATANGVQAGASYVQRVYQPSTSLTQDTTHWCLGRPGRVEETRSHNQYGGSAITRITQLSWDTTSCRATQQIIEPGDSQSQVTTDFSYDAFGNVNLQALTGIAMAGRSSAVYWGTDGRFALTATNALSQTTSYAWDEALGAPRSETDPNGLTTTWQYDEFGRRTREQRTDGTVSTWSYEDCAASGCVNANNKMIVNETQWDALGAPVTDRRLYTDRLERPIAVSARMLSGTYNRVETEYDALGRIARVSAPCWWSACTPHWTSFSYDLLNRPTQRSRPLSDTDPTPQTTAFYYEGLTTRQVDALGSQRTQIASVLGATTRSVDHAGYFQQFDADGFGNVVRVSDSLGAVLLSNTYTVRGLRTASSELATGSWSYTPNALGEILAQRNAKQQLTTFEYDLLGRPTKRTEPEGISTWAWGASAQSKNIGRLESVSGPGYAESYTYDGLGRPQTKTIDSDASYSIDYAYNSLGALDTLTYPASTVGYRLKLKYEYQYGQLLRVKDANVPASIFWTANDTDARGQVISETLGNGVQALWGYDAATGKLDYAQSGPGGAIQSFNYIWDAVGNLVQRQDLRQGLTETFGYDNLHRLTSVSGPAPMTQTYDARGNLTYRSGTVDAGNSHNISWTSDNLPATIAGPSGYSSQFFYTPDRSRYKQQANYGGTSETALYIGGLMEKVTLGATTSWKHYIGGGAGPVAVYTRKSSGVNEIHYLTQDHLGSVSAVTDAAGAVEVRLSYGAYGQRRNATAGSGNPSSGEWSGITNTTRRGYTFHEMLDNLDLIHMNGRVYDPRVGRFLSADPYVDGVLDTQGWNRYAYVKNNPLSALDPSGFGDKDAGGDCQSSSESHHVDCGGHNNEGSDIIAAVIAAATRIRDSDLSDRWRWVFGSEPSPTSRDQPSEGGGGTGGGTQEEQKPGKCFNGSLGIGGTLAIFAGGGGGSSLGISYGGSLLDTRLFGQAQAYGLIGIGLYGGVGLSASGGAGAAPRGGTYGNGAHFEFDISGPVGLSVTRDQFTNSSSGTGGYQARIPGGRLGVGAGIFMGGGPTTQTTYGLPTLGELWNSTADLLSPIIDLPLHESTVCTE